ncbi:MAG: DUF5069 domain-containing protein [Opitutus sp.]|nr:DUF5069 domain-containing protein [Opitutus sp.]
MAAQPAPRGVQGTSPTFRSEEAPSRHSEITVASRARTHFIAPMPAVPGLRSPYDKSIGGLHHLGRMLDKIRLKLAGNLPPDFERNYGLSVGLDGQLCGFLNLKFADVEARVQAGGTDAEVAEWMFTQGMRPNRTQTMIWNEHSRKLGLNDRISSYLQQLKLEAGMGHVTANTSFDLIELSEERTPPPPRG